MPSYSSILLDYLGTDVAANRPVSLNIAPTALGLYAATDTGVFSAWYGGAWHTVVAGSAVSQIIAGSGLAGGTITASGTISLDTIAATELLGNPGTVAAVPSGIAIGPGLTLPATGTLAAEWQTGTVVSVVGSDLDVNSGTIDLAPITAASLFGNPGTAVAKPSALAVGSGLTLSAVGTLSNTGILSLVAGTNVTISGGNTISASAGASGITSLVIGSGLSPAGTISSGGTTVSLGTIAASSLMGNAGAVGAVPGAIAVGTNLTLSAAGTLSASAGGGSGTVTQVATSGAGIAGGPITGSGTLTVEWNGGTVNAVGPEFVEPSGTLHFDQMPTYISASTTIDTTYFGKNLVDNSTGASDIVLTLTTLAASTHLTFNLQNNSAHHYVRLRPATGVTINGVASSDYLLPNFTGGEVAIDSTGTAYTTGAALSFWNPSAGYVTALNGLKIVNDGTFSTNGTLTPAVDGTSIILSGGSLSATGTAAVGLQFSAVIANGAVNTGADATGGNIVAFDNAETIYNVYIGLNSMVIGGSYVAQICPVNASRVVQAVNTSATVVATGTVGEFPKFSFGSGVVVSAGTNYAISCSRIDGGAGFVLPLRYSGGSSGGFIKNMQVLGAQTNLGIFQNNATAITNGITLGAVNFGYYSMGLDKTF